MDMGVEAVRHTMYFDVKPEELEGIELGEKVTMRVTGTVKSLTAPTKRSKKEIARAKKDGYELDTDGSMSVNVDKMNIEGQNEFTDLTDMD